MSIEKSDFFKEAALRICGNLEIENALHSLLLYLKDFMPVARMYLSYYDDTLQSTNIIAHADEKMSEKLDLIVPLPKDASEIAKNILSYGDVVLVENPQEFPLTKHTMKVLNVSASSIIAYPAYDFVSSIYESGISPSGSLPTYCDIRQGDLTVGYSSLSISGEVPLVIQSMVELPISRLDGRRSYHA